MAEYMSREDYCEMTCGKENREGYKTCHNCSMLNVPSTDVQPVDRWISVEDRPPEDDGDCLVWYRCDIAFGKSESWGITHYSRGDWYTKHLHGDNIVVLYWQSMPEPPSKQTE